MNTERPSDAEINAMHRELISRMRSAQPHYAPPKSARPDYAAQYPHLYPNGTPESNDRLYWGVTRSPELVIRIERIFGCPPRYTQSEREIDRARYSEARRRGGVAPWERDCV